METLVDGHWACLELGRRLAEAIASRHCWERRPRAKLHVIEEMQRVEAAGEAIARVAIVDTRF